MNTLGAMIFAATIAFAGVSAAIIPAATPAVAAVAAR
jgi:hypothetical protein